MTRSALLAAYPQLFVADMAVACDFYVCRPGLTVAFLFQRGHIRGLPG